MSLARITNNIVTYLHTERHCRGLLQLDLIHRIKSLGYAQPFAKHPGSLAAGTNASGTSLWIEQPKTTSSLSLRAHSTPFGESLINTSANDDLANYTGRHCRGLLRLQSIHRIDCLGFAQPTPKHIRDKATGLNYMHPKGISSQASPLRAQARYQDPIIGRFLSIDPVGFSLGMTGSFNRYSYVSNDPMNATDPDGRQGLGFGGVEDAMKMRIGEKVEQQYNKATDLNKRAELASVRAGYYKELGCHSCARDFIKADINSRPKLLRNSKSIKFSQDSVGANFSDGKPVQGLIDGLKSGSIKPTDVTPIRVFTADDGTTVSLDNRRLYAAQEAGVQISTVPAAESEVARETQSGRKNRQQTKTRVRKGSRRGPTRINRRRR